MRKITAGYAGTVVALLLGAAILPAQAAVAEPTAPELAHCAVEIFELGENTEPPASAVCFATEDEVAAYLAAMDGSATDDSSRATATSIAVGTVYKDAAGAGGSLTFWGSNGCAGATFGFATLASDWEISISSVRATNGCWGTVYAATNYGGTRLNCTPFCSALGALNDSVKSVVFRPSGTLG